MIYKYTLNPYTSTELGVNEGYMILDIERQDSQICVWINTNTKAPACQIKVVPVMTGSNPPDSVTCYFGTVQTKDGLVVHYYV